MAKANKFVHFNTRAAFDAHFTERGINPSAAEGNDLYYYTVYIKDTEEIYTHGKFYGDKGVEIDILALQNGDTEVGKALYQKLMERFETVPGRLIGHYVFKDPSAPNFAIHAPSMLIIFDYIDAINAFSGHHIYVHNNDINFDFMTLASTGECVFGGRTIVTKDMFRTGYKEGTIRLGATDIPVNGLKSAAYVDVEDIIYTLDVAETDASVSLSDEEFETIVAHESINVVVNGKTYTSTQKNSFAGGAIIQYECSFVYHDCVTNITITFDRNAKTYYCVKQDNDIYAQHADFATDLSGRVEATPEVFTYRPSAGDKSIKDDNAFIRRVKGNSVVFNQLVKDNGYSNNGVVTTFNNGVFTLAGTPTSTYFNTSEAMPLVLGHTMLLQVFVVANPKNVKARFGDLNQNVYIPIDTGGGVIYTASGQVNHYLGFYDRDLTNIDFTGLQIFQMVVDLTAMFGTGNEPTTVEEFRALYPNSYYPYNPGELRNFACSGIKTVGFNQWDEQWEMGYISTDNGINGPSTTCIRSANFIKCLPDTEYSATKPTRRILIAFYDFSKQYIGNVSTQNLFTTPTNCAFIRFFVEYGTTVSTYNHDICINLHHTGYRDGEYEPYKEVSHALTLSQITNGEPLRKAGSVYDEINETEYIRRVGVVDMGTLIWVAEGNNIFVVYQMPNMIVTTTDNSRLDGLFCAKYATDSTPDVGPAMADKTMKRHQGRLYLRDTSFTDVPSLKASLSGVLLQYELAEPIVTPIETPIDFNYYVEDFGTEEAILADDSAPFSADIIYQFNAVDRIRQNDLNIDRLEDKVLALPSEFKTINGNSIIGSGDLIITAGNVGTEDDAGEFDDVNTQTYLRYVEQSLTDEQKLQARINIGASSNIIIGNATQDTTSLRHNTLLKWTEDGTTESMFLEFPTNDGSTVLNCGFLLYLTPDATSDYSLYLDGIEIY